MWPFSDAGDATLLLALYIATLALHAVFIGYVVAGTAFALVRPADPIAETVRGRLPFMLGCGITAGVAPLLFLQLLHQRRFYTANLLLGPRWIAIVPALIVGFYALYGAKTWQRFRRPALALALACFTFVAYSWSELHELMQADPHWTAFYAAGERMFVTASIIPRLVVFGGAMATTFATLAAWSADDRRGIAVLALASRLVSIGGAVWLWRTGFPVDGPVLAWEVLLAGAVAVEAVGWALVWRGGTDRTLAVATGAGTGALVAAVIAREAPRMALIEPTHALAANAGGTLVFAVALAVGVAAVIWIVRTVRGDTSGSP
jgi:hypothetical protein